MHSPTRSRGLNQFSALIRAAANPDPTVLRAVLASRKSPTSSADRGSNGYKSREELEDDYGPNSMLNGWARIQPPLRYFRLYDLNCLEILEILLQAGANPSGGRHELAGEIPGFCPFVSGPSIPPYVDIDGDVPDKKSLVECMELSQTAPLTELEIEQRVHAVTPFWRFPETARLDQFPLGDEMHCLVVAASSHQ